jgi:hypothetical protein
MNFGPTSSLSASDLNSLHFVLVAAKPSDASTGELRREL